MELKVICQCGQKYKFDVEPVGGQMPFAINCPVCQTDGTATANSKLAEHFRSVPPPPRPSTPAPITTVVSTVPPMAVPPPPPPPSMGGLRINHAAPAPASVVTPGTVTGGGPPPAIGALRPLSTDKKARVKTNEFSMVRGIIGAVVGSAIGCALLYAFWIWAQFRFPLMGVAVGAAAGYGARWLARGTDSTMGIIVAVIAAGSVTGTYVLMYGGFAVFTIISIVICASVAYRAASD